jgi:hypothetical protein
VSGACDVGHTSYPLTILNLRYRSLGCDVDHIFTRVCRLTLTPLCEMIYLSQNGRGSHKRKDRIMCDKYNGYTNRETWAMALWLNNDKGFGESFLDYMRVHVEDRVNTEPVADWWKYDSYAEQHAKDWVDTWLTPSGYIYEHGDDWPMGLAEIASDIGSLHRINWFEIMYHVLSED